MAHVVTLPKFRLESFRVPLRESHEWTVELLATDAQVPTQSFIGGTLHKHFAAMTIPAVGLCTCMRCRSRAEAAATALDRTTALHVYLPAGHADSHEPFTHDHTPVDHSNHTATVS